MTQNTEELKQQTRAKRARDRLARSYFNEETDAFIKEFKAFCWKWNITFQDVFQFSKLLPRLWFYGAPAGEEVKD